MLSSVVFFAVMMVAVLVGFMLFSGKRYCAEVFPEKEVWGYEDLAHAAFGAVGKVYMCERHVRVYLLGRAHKQLQANYWLVIIRDVIRGGAGAVRGWYR